MNWIGMGAVYPAIEPKVKRRIYADGSNWEIVRMTTAQGIAAVASQKPASLFLCANFNGLPLHLKSPVGRSPGHVFDQIRAWDGDVAANLTHLYQLRRLVPAGLRLANDFCAGDLPKPGAHFYRPAGFIHQFGLIPGAEFVRTIFQVNSWQYCEKSSADLQEAQHLLDESGQIFRVSETAIDVGDDLEFPKLLDRILAETFAREIP